MAPKIRSTDWDRQFSPNAPRRGGPLRVLANLIFICIALGLLAAAGLFGIRYREQLRAQVRLQATMNAFGEQTVVARDTERVASREATIVARTAAAAPTALPSPAAVLGRGQVLVEANLRTTPEVSDATRIGLIAVGDQIEFLGEQLVGGQSWYRIRITAGAPTRPEGAVPIGSEGWASATVLSPPQP